MKSVTVFFGNKSVSIRAREVGFLRKGVGLMFRTSSTENLFFSFRRKTKRAFTGLFVFFPFLILWLDERYKVVDVALVRPFTRTIYPQKPYRNVIELPLNKKNSDLIRFFRRRGKHLNISDAKISLSGKRR